MDAILEWLKGYKSYFVIFALVVVHILGGEGILSPDQEENYQGILTLALGGTLSAKANRLVEALKEMKA